MSTSYYAKAMLGIQVRKSDLFVTAMVKHCVHDHHFKFCPECGRPGGSFCKKGPIPHLVINGDGEYQYKSLLIQSRVYLDDLDDDDDEIVMGLLLGNTASHESRCSVMPCPLPTSAHFDHICEAVKGSPFEDKPILLYVILTASY